MTDVVVQPKAVGAPDLTIFLSLRPDRYRSAECQLGAHHACPGGVRMGLAGGGVDRLYCQCAAVGCACRQRSAIEEPPRLDTERAGQG